MLPEKWKKALPLLANGVVFVALGVFALVGNVPEMFMPIVAFVASGFNIFFGIKWNPPTNDK
jgi:uncharacterized membrane protein